MNTETAILIAEVPAVTAIAAAVMAWMIQRLVHRVDSLAEDAANQETTSARHELRITALEVTVHNLDRKMPQVSENLAVVAGFVERHERWHERHPDGSHNTPSS